MKPGQRVSLLGLSCREASRLISESLDRELTLRERWSLRIHTFLCTLCRRFEQQSALIRGTLPNMPDAIREKWSDGTAKLSHQRKAEIKRLLAEARRADLHD